MNKRSKIIFTLACSLLAFGLAGCNSSNNSNVMPTYTPYVADEIPLQTPYATVTPMTSDTIPPNAANTSMIPANASVATVLKEMDKTLKTSKVKDKDGTLIGAVKAGKEFTFDKKTFQLYRFTDASLLDEAKTGTMSLDINGTKKMMNSTVNGNFVLLYDEINAKVVDCFEALNF